MNKEKVSVVIPAYNAEPFIDRAIDSILNQTYKNVEIVVINDGSKDKTEKKVKTYTEKYDNIKIISTENGGVCKARNIGIENSTGDYIIFLDADDELLNNAIEVMHEYAQKENADIVSALKYESIHDDLSKEYSILCDDDYLIKVIEGHSVGYSTVGKLFTREHLSDVRFVEGRKIHEDSFFNFQSALKKPRVVDLKETLYRINPTENSASRSAFSEKYFDILYFVERKAEELNEKRPEYQDKIKNMYVRAQLAFLKVACNSGAPKEYKKKEKELIKEIRKNKKYYKPAIKADKRWFFVVTHHLYFLYKFLYKVKHGI